MGSTSQPFKPLAGSKEVRLLHLSPAVQPNATLSGKLQHVNLDDNPIYEALSYEWGNPEKTHIFSLDDATTVSITESLHHALQDIRHESPSQADRIIWADAICINQDDISERQQQVSIMGSIYRQAQRVITYIGPETDNSSLGIEFASHLRRYGASFAPSLLLGARISSGTPQKQGMTEFPPEADDYRAAAVRKLILRGWVGRCWCAQEYLLNANVTLRCGRTDFPSEYLIAEVAQLCVEGYIPSFCLPQSEDDPKSLRECHRVLAELRRATRLREMAGQRLPLLDLLKFSHPLRATDPRDKVYSLVGLMRQEVKVDYTCRVADLYIQVAKSILAESPNLSILYSNLTKKSLRLPSWVPDWSTWQFGSYGAACRAGYSASGRSETEIEVHDMEDVLEIKGRLIDRINWLGDSIGQYYDGRFEPGDVKQRAWIKEQVEAVRSQAVHDSYSFEDYTPDDILWRCLTGNITLKEDPAMETYKAHYYAHLNCREDSSEIVQKMGREFHDAVRRRSRYRRLGATEQGYFGAVPETSKEGDWVCMFHGGKHLFVVRECETGFEYVGHAYVDGLMNGECLELSCEEREIRLV